MNTLHHKGLKKWQCKLLIITLEKHMVHLRHLFAYTETFSKTCDGSMCCNGILCGSAHSHHRRTPVKHEQN